MRTSARKTQRNTLRAASGWLGGLLAVAGLAAAGYGVVSTYAGPAAAPPSPSPSASPSTSQSATVDARPTTPDPASPVAESTEGWVPRRLLIPNLDVTARVLPVSTVDGVLVPPDDPDLLGWWRDGARPGSAAGSVLVTGHTVHTGGGAMEHIGELSVGAEIVVDTTAGPVTYQVVSVRYYPKQTLARRAERVFDQASDPRLVLITCQNWDGTAYEGNTVVVAEPASSS